MSVDRDGILNALFQLLKSKLGLGNPGAAVVTIGRRHMMPPQLTSAMQPALFVLQAGELRDPHPRGTGGKLTMHALLVAYVYDVTANVDGSTQLNILIGKIEDALAPDDGSTLVLTLGGKAYECWIDGEADIDPGIYGQQAVAVIPVTILVP